MNNYSSNLFWSVYKNLEREFIALSDIVYICDEDKCDNEGVLISREQLSVYSVKIAELLIRTQVEIEAICCSLYKRDISIELPKHTDKDGNKKEEVAVGKVVTAVGDLFSLDSKLVNVVGTTVYLTKKENRTFAPIGYKSKKEGDYYSAAKAVQHGRHDNLHKASIGILIRALAGLYIYNLYYADIEYETDKFDERVGSELFSVIYDDEKSDDAISAVYLICKSDKKHEIDLAGKLQLEAGEIELTDDAIQLMDNMHFVYTLNKVPAQVNGGTQ
jgi:hypothetical protein